LIKDNFPELALLKFDQDHVLTLGVFDRDILMGIFQLLCLFDEAEIISIAVSPDYRRQGLAKNLFQNFLSQKNEIKRVFLEVSVQNQPAIHFYTFLGFKKIGERKNYYQNKKLNILEDAWIMEFTCQRL
jgi:ribosomal protein S18 acetylase RimI-like enzyme